MSEAVKRRRETAPSGVSTGTAPRALVAPHAGAMAMLVDAAPADPHLDTPAPPGHLRLDG